MLRDRARPPLGTSPGWDPVAERPVPPSPGMRLAPVFVFAVSLLLYLRTLLPGMAFDDWGEMQTVPHVLGIAHPTGYPTYILTAWLFELLPFGSIAFRANLFAAVCVAVALAAMTSTTMRLGVRPTIAAAVAIATGAIGTIWASAVVAEVNALHLAFMRADRGPLAGVGRRAAHARPRARRPAGRPVARQPPADRVRGAVLRRCSRCGRADGRCGIASG